MSPRSRPGSPFLVTRDADQQQQWHFRSGSKALCPLMVPIISSSRLTLLRKGHIVRINPISNELVSFAIVGSLTTVAMSIMPPKLTDLVLVSLFLQ